MINDNDLSDLLGAIFTRTDLELWLRREHRAISDRLGEGLSFEELCSKAAEALVKAGHGDGDGAVKLQAALVMRVPGQKERIDRAFTGAVVAPPSLNSAAVVGLVAGAMAALAGEPAAPGRKGRTATTASKRPQAGAGAPRPPKRTAGGGIRVLISYAHDPDDLSHGERVAKFAKDLRNAGIDVHIDQDEPVWGPAGGWPKWMTHQLDAANYVVCVVSQLWCTRFEGRDIPELGHGCAYEANLIRNRLYEEKGDGPWLVLVSFAGGAYIGSSASATLPAELPRKTILQIPDRQAELAAGLLNQSPAPSPRRAPRRSRAKKPTEGSASPPPPTANGGAAGSQQGPRTRKSRPAADKGKAKGAALARLRQLLLEHPRLEGALRTQLKLADGDVAQALVDRELSVSLVALAKARQPLVSAIGVPVWAELAGCVLSARTSDHDRAGELRMAAAADD